MICYLALGSNLKSPERQIRTAIQAIASLPKTQVLKTASLYESIAWGRKIQPCFFNTVIKVKTRLRALDLLKQCQQIEKTHGRIRRIRWGSRTLDIDILIFGKHFSCHPRLQIPHPRLLERDFMFLPLLEISPKIRLPDGSKVSDSIAKNPTQTCFTISK
ncbi:2-amino-4-hydroxy-6- hydroxymethyldihydropteridine pyrophosphokinase [Legionella quinlivanii]|uniref:2-amino-4-hydroxy-6-hydroxymethyldihydropteridine pyrophosphokinase n=1 Tax=Legionella quinlivanii TaxID=45073 RepID=A0A0W0XTW3_9GAMM|nr:2-amino-4-hydroxy-6-hydroxymethyldihydropteridine diphosphokinase [Legionella quinlivanii]KTD48005.1 2-amino-4-hydroxy-6- hydroxymethyldihydropteridine pyrophosphokinase [Legionella quinlivanii]SEG21045.1 2-amino-4-hydroxy-6-hydroxymethyldihydropteridinediphosphokinase [Legionella quinlivanii DSM 21216]STY11117.1 2-amino-4-hydroxy-6-hydroxymethyldihydropteridinepyrophosphokinase [Legionella quinlivanii]